MWLDSSPLLQDRYRMRERKFSPLETQKLKSLLVLPISALHMAANGKQRPIRWTKKIPRFVTVWRGRGTSD
jgi:hypothetical protein